ncbi:Putative virulence factor [Sphingobacterium nematocida]|uniref:Putative virulence factor n=1 Tax=Sphingobacterium nematocida TaxID=1513896 RepID=A0A1T5GIG1_9SPHI|nr:virulence factor SrfC family protein [Sphingobacterium nematocida]SKC08117.1 Putative virulence factor [Sphingobacterium nematocida]
MKNYSKEEIAKIKEVISDKIVLVNNTVSWVDQNLKFEERNQLLLKLKNNLNTLQKIEKGIGNKPVMAVFGASQVGKSYLIKNLLSDQSKPFYINNGVTRYDFLKDINPPGTGAESTGVVTRFTADNTVLFEDYPIRINILSAKDVLNILLDSYFLDLKKITTFITKKDLEEHLSGLEQNHGNLSQSYMTEYDVLEIKSYFQKHLSKHTILFQGLYETRFFERVGQLIQYYSPQQWSDVFSVLWNKSEIFTLLFNELISKLELLGFVDSGYIAFDNVLRGCGEILDVKRLQELRSCTNITTMKRGDGSTVNLSISFLAALISELVLTIPSELSESREFLNHSDLLDFPGARSRMPLDQNEISEKYLDAMLLRGKVSYLFNKYSDDFNINNLLFCTNDKQLEVNEIPTLLADWISNNIGNNVNDRSAALQNASTPPLFVIFTFFNNQLRFDTTNDVNYTFGQDSLDYKWQIRFERFFEQEIVTQGRDWHTNWSHSCPHFSNFYLLRDFKYSEDTFLGYTAHDKELEVNPERVGFMNELKSSFINYGFVQKHFTSPEQSWNAAASLNHDGAQLIIHNLAHVSNNITKTNHYLNRLNNLIQEIKQDLIRFIYTDDVANLRTSNMAKVNQFQLSFNTLLARDLGLFNTFIDAISLVPLDLYHLLNQNMVVEVADKILDTNTPAAILKSQYVELNNLKSKDAVVAVLKNKFWLNDETSVISFLQDSNIIIEDLYEVTKSESKSQYYTRLVLDYWKNKIASLENFKTFTQLGLNKGSLDFVVTHYQQLLDKRKISEKLISILDDVISQIQINHGHEVFLAETFALIINDLAINFDLNFFSENEIEEAIHTFPATTFFANKQPNDESEIAISRLFDNNNLDIQTITLEKYNKWVESLRTSLLVNAGFVTYDVEANERLKGLITNYESIQLN